MKIKQEVMTNTSPKPLIIENAAEDITITELWLCSLFTSTVYFDILLYPFNTKPSAKHFLIKEKVLKPGSSKRMFQSLVIPKGYNLYIKALTSSRPAENVFSILSYSLFTESTSKFIDSRLIDCLNVLNHGERQSVSVSDASTYSGIAIEEIEKLLGMTNGHGFAPLYKGHIFRPIGHREYRQDYTVDYKAASMFFTLEKADDKWVINENL